VLTHGRESVVCYGASATGTDVATAIGLSAIHAGARVRCTTAVSPAELLAADDDHGCGVFVSGGSPTNPGRAL